MAEFNTKCPYCECIVTAEEEWIGMEAECPSCSKTFVIEKSIPSVPHISLPHKRQETVQESSDSTNTFASSQVTEINDTIPQNNCRQKKFWKIREIIASAITSLKKKERIKGKKIRETIASAITFFKKNQRIKSRKFIVIFTSAIVIAIGITVYSVLGHNRIKQQEDRAEKFRHEDKTEKVALSYHGDPSVLTGAFGFSFGDTCDKEGPGRVEITSVPEKVPDFVKYYVSLDFDGRIYAISAKTASKMMVFGAMSDANKTILRNIFSAISDKYTGKMTEEIKDTNAKFHFGNKKAILLSYYTSTVSNTSFTEDELEIEYVDYERKEQFEREQKRREELQDQEQQKQEQKERQQKKAEYSKGL